jgi:hypothetical protein
MFQFTGWTFEEGGRVYEFLQDEDDKEGDDVELLDKVEPPKGHYVARDGSERSGMPSVRPPASEERVYRTLNLLIEGWFGTATSASFRV